MRKYLPSIIILAYCFAGALLAETFFDSDDALYWLFYALWVAACLTVASWVALWWKRRGES